MYNLLTYVLQIIAQNNILVHWPSVLLHYSDCKYVLMLFQKDAGYKFQLWKLVTQQALLTSSIRAVE